MQISCHLSGRKFLVWDLIKLEWEDEFDLRVVHRDFSRNGSKPNQDGKNNYWIEAPSPFTCNMQKNKRRHVCLHCHCYHLGFFYSFPWFIKAQRSVKKKNNVALITVRDNQTRKTTRKLNSFQRNLTFSKHRDVQYIFPWSVVQIKEKRDSK